MRLSWWIVVATAILPACVDEQTDAELREEVANTVAAHHGVDVDCVGRALEDVPREELDSLGRNFGARDGLHSDELGDESESFIDAARACGDVLTEAELHNAVARALAERYVADERCVQEALEAVSAGELEAFAKLLEVIKHDYDFEEVTFTMRMSDVLHEAEAC